MPAFAESPAAAFQGFHADLVPHQPSGESENTMASATCRVRGNLRSVVIHMAASPFQHVKDSTIQSDAVLSAALTRTVGRLVVTPRSASDRTRLGSKDEPAAIAFGISGNGRAEIEMQLAIDAKDAPAGRHRTTVVMTITSN